MPGCWRSARARRYRVTPAATAAPVEGETIGHVESPYGLFLLSAGRRQRQGQPRCSSRSAAYKDFEIGERIGELLVEQHAATSEQVDQAVDQQQQLRTQKLGDILLSRKVVTPEQLLEAIEQQAKMPIVRIGEALTSLGMISEAQLEEALAQQKNDRSVPLGELLVRMRIVSREDLQTALARKMGYPLVDLEAFPVETPALQQAQLPGRASACRCCRCCCATAGWWWRSTTRRGAATRSTRPSSSPRSRWCRCWRRASGIELAIKREYARIGDSATERRRSPDLEETIDNSKVTDELVETLEKEVEQSASSAVDDDKQIEQSDNSLVRLINNMIVEASRDGVSDIHIESYPGKEKLRIRFRKDGVLSTYLELPSSYRAALVARIKIMCDLDISERRKPQDGKINFAKFSPQHRLELRVATIPTNQQPRGRRDADPGIGQADAGRRARACRRTT